MISVLELRGMDIIIFLDSCCRFKGPEWELSWRNFSRTSAWGLRRSIVRELHSGNELSGGKGLENSLGISESLAISPRGLSCL